MPSISNPFFSYRCLATEFSQMTVNSKRETFISPAQISNRLKNSVPIPFPRYSDKIPTTIYAEWAIRFKLPFSADRYPTSLPSASATRRKLSPSTEFRMTDSILQGLLSFPLVHTAYILFHDLIGPSFPKTFPHLLQITFYTSFSVTSINDV